MILCEPRRRDLAVPHLLIMAQSRVAAPATVTRFFNQASRNQSALDRVFLSPTRYNRVHKVTLMTRLLGHFDGKVIVPDEPVDLPRGTKLVIQIERASSQSHAGISGEEFQALAKELKFEPGDLDEMQKAIDAECERIDPDGW